MPATDEAPSGTRHPRAVLAATILGSSVSFIDGSIVNVALPAIGREFAADAASLQWTVNAYLLPLGALVLLGGAAGDRFGRKRVFDLGLILFGIASLACTLAPTVAVLLAARAAQGIAAALLVPSSLAILGASFTGEAKGRAIGTWAAVGAIGGALGPILGGYIVDTLSWRVAFLINVPIIAAAWWLARSIDESRNRSAGSAPLDLGGALLATLGLGALTWGLTVLPERGIGDGLVAGSLVLAIVLLVGFVGLEARRGERAMMPLSLFAARTFNGVSILTLFLYAALGGLVVLLPFRLITIDGYSAAQAGSALLPFAVIMGLGSRTMGRLGERIGARTMLTVGPVVAGAGFALLMRLDADPVAYWLDVFPALVVLAVGITVTVAPLTTTVMSAVDDDHAGTASGVNNAIARIAGLLAVALLGPVLAGGDAASFSAGFRTAALIGAALSVLGGLAALWLVRTEPAA